MIPRGTIIAALIGIEIAILGEMVVAARGEQPVPSSVQRMVAEAAHGPNLVEGGPHRLFDAGANAALVVDIGYADLTILTGTASQIDVALDASTDFGLLRATAPITVRKDGDTIRIATTRHGWSAGDNRMVTVVVTPGTKVTVVDAGDIKANGLRAEASFKSVGNGSVTIEDYEAPGLRVATSDGDISLRQIVAGRLTATSRNGHIDGAALRVRDGSVETSNDRVRLGFAPGADTLVSANTSNGAIRISGFAANASAGNAPTSSGDADESDSFSRTVRIGAGSGRLDVHATNGDIDLRQEI